jgi:hypothetical protein
MLTLASLFSTMVIMALIMRSTSPSACKPAATNSNIEVMCCGTSHDARLGTVEAAGGAYEG